MALVIGKILLDKMYDELLPVLSLVIGVVGTVLCGLFLLINLMVMDMNYQNKLEEKAMLEYRIQKGEEIAGNELLYSQVVEFNNDLRSTKILSKNPWVNCFNNWKIAEIDYIEIDKED
jgi:hypothetical protein